MRLTREQTQYHKDVTFLAHPIYTFYLFLFCRVYHFQRRGVRTIWQSSEFCRLRQPRLENWFEKPMSSSRGLNSQVRSLLPRVASLYKALCVLL